MVALLERAVEDVNPDFDFQSFLDPTLTVGEQMTLFESKYGIYFGKRDPVMEDPRLTTCERCNVSFSYGRNTARFCSTYCRVTQSRKIKMERALARILLESPDS